MLIFQQWGSEKNYRLGNSVIWMSKLLPLMRSLNVHGVFPLAHELYGGYLSSDSYWLDQDLFTKAANDFINVTDHVLLSTRLQDFIRFCQSEYESLHDLSPYQWNKDALFLDVSPALTILSGSFSFADARVLDLMKSDKLVLIQEPFDRHSTINSDAVDYFNIAPNQSLIRSQENYFAGYQSDIKVGLHIRRGDYQDFAGGKYFYSDDFWVEYITNLLTRQNVKIFIFTNDDISGVVNNLNSDGRIILSGGSPEVDIARMMMMDELYGPPSTFSKMSVMFAKHFFNKDIIYNHI